MTTDITLENVAREMIAETQFQSDTKSLRVHFLAESYITLSARLAEVEAEAGKMLADADHEYNQKTNDMILRHTGQMERARHRAEAAEAKLTEREAQVTRLLEMQDDQDQKLKDAEAENARLREALTGIKRAGNARMSSDGGEGERK